MNWKSHKVKSYNIIHHLQIIKENWAWKFGNSIEEILNSFVESIKEQCCLFNTPTSCNVERSFVVYKSILLGRHCQLTDENLKNLFRGSQVPHKLIDFLLSVY